MAYVDSTAGVRMCICVRMGLIAYVDSTATVANVYLCQGGSHSLC